MNKLKVLYAQIWNTRPHICENCGVYIPGDPVVHNFAHIKSKGARPDLKYDPDNIRILCSSWDNSPNNPGCHELEHTYPEKFRARTLEPTV